MKVFIGIDLQDGLRIGYLWIAEWIIRLSPIRVPGSLRFVRALQGRSFDDVVRTNTSDLNQSDCLAGLAR